MAEDNPVNRQVVAAFLDKLGCRHEMAENGAEAVKALREQTFDVVLMDISMPVLDGPSAARAIRALDGPAAQIPIIAVTAHALRPSAIGFSMQA